MKRIVWLFFLFVATAAKAQGVKARIVDSANNKPLAYAIVLYNNRQNVLYSDLDGYITFISDSLKNGDTLVVQYLGYEKKYIPAKALYPGRIILMEPEIQSLQPVFVSTCRKTGEFVLNKKVGRIRQYFGPGPETRLIVMARYNNNSGVRGSLKTLSILLDEKSPNLKIPIRIHWYQWDNETASPGKELTDTDIVVYPYKEGWNDFTLPDNTIDCPSDWIVIGLEFIYPPEYEKQFKTLVTTDSKLKWLSEMDHRWSLAMQYIDNEHERGFFMVNNGAIQSIDKKYDRYYIRPAVKLSILICKD